MALWWGEEERSQGPEMRNRYYISFFLDGEQIFVSDSVYVQSETARPYVGKIMRMWEEKTLGRKRVRIRWFFRPEDTELDVKSDPKELFIAAGKGMAGVEDVNPLEVVTGKCRVVCTSTHPLNKQPSSDELQNAEFFFYKAYNAETQTVSMDLNEVLDDSCKATKLFSRIHSESQRSTTAGATGEKRKTRTWEEDLEQIEKNSLVICLENLDRTTTLQELQKNFSLLFPDVRFESSVVHKLQSGENGLSATSGRSLICFVDKQQGLEVLKSLQRNFAAFKDIERVPQIATVLGIPTESLSQFQALKKNEKLDTASCNHPDGSSTVGEKWRLLYERHKMQREMLQKQHEEEMTALMKELAEEVCPP